MPYYPNSIDWKPIQEGGLRRLRLGEINLANSLFGFSILYHQVWVHLESYLPFDSQNPGQAMTPNGEMWFRKIKYEDDFSMPTKQPTPNAQHLFLHEMMHVWQHQRGMMVRMRGLFSWAVDYYYTLDKAILLDYGLEQQAAMVADYWLLKTYGFGNRSDLYLLKDYDPSEPVLSLISRYEKVLGRFPH